jgi:hypothetical protein
MAVSELQSSGTGQCQSGKSFIHHFSFIDDITRSFLFSSKWLSVNGGRATAIPRNEGDLRLFDLTAEGHERV